MPLGHTVATAFESVIWGRVLGFWWGFFFLSFFFCLCVVFCFFNARVMWSCSCQLTLKFYKSLLVLLKSCWLVCVLNRGAVFIKNFLNQKQYMKMFTSP